MWCDRLETKQGTEELCTYLANLSRSSRRYLREKRRGQLRKPFSSYKVRDAANVTLVKITFQNR